MEDTQPQCTIRQKLWLLPGEGVPAWLRTLIGLGGCLQQIPELLFSFGHTRAINQLIRCHGGGWVSVWEGHAEGCSSHPAFPGRESGSKGCPALQQPPQVDGGSLSWGPTAAAPPALHLRHDRLHCPVLTGRGSCREGGVCGGAALGRLGWAQQPAQLSCPCSQVQASNGKPLLSVTVNQIGEIRGLFA